MKMNSKQPELSIFQGSPSIHIENNQMQREEEEAVEDHRRRDAELHDELEREFGNISEEEFDDEANETAHSSTHQYHYRNHQLNNNNQMHESDGPHKDFPLRNDFTNLRNLIDTKSREIEQISALMASERIKHKAAIDEYEKRLTIAESEKERALMSRNQSQENLVESKGRLIEIKEENEKLLSKIKLLENENEKLVREIESTKLMLSDVQTKYNMVEKNVMFNAERNTDQIIKQTQERHNAQIAMMQQQIDNLKRKKDDLEHDHKHLDIRYEELQKSREAMLIEKSEIINQLNKNIEESQRQCQDLLQRPDLMHENKRLQVAVQTMEYQKDEMSLTISKLQRKVQEQQSEIETMDSIMNECSKNNQSFAEITNFVNREPLKNVNSSTPVATETKLSKVMDELIKSQNNIRTKREEIKILEKQLSEKDSEIASMKSDENKLLIDLNKYKDEALKLENKMSLLHKEIANGACDKSEQERLRQELVTRSNECDELRAMIDSLKLSEVEINRKLETKEEQLKAISQELNEAHMQLQANSDASNDCEKCKEYATKLERLEVSYLEAQNSNADYLGELNELKNELASAQRSLDALQDKISLHNTRDKEIEKLQEKAREFENYMRTASNSDSQTSCDTNTSENRIYTESKIRDEMARIFANQIKTLEKRFLEEAKKLQSQIMSLTDELQGKSADLEVATEQLELLKFALVQEREEFEQILKMKDDSIRERVEKYQKHVSDLNEQIDLIDAERTQIETLRKQIEEERSLMSKTELETAQKLKKLQQESNKIIEELSEKYKTVKKTATNYKQYSEDMEKHYRGEVERIKSGYADAIEKARARYKESLKEKEEEHQQKLKRVEQEYEFKVDVLKGMLQKSQAP